jgi:hypothetical protein
MTALRRIDLIDTTSVAYASCRTALLCGIMQSRAPQARACISAVSLCELLVLVKEQPAEARRKSKSMCKDCPYASLPV